MRKPTTPLYLHVDDDLYTRLGVLAVHHRVSKAELVRKWIADGVARAEFALAPKFDLAPKAGSVKGDAIFKAFGGEE